MVQVNVHTTMDTLLYLRLPANGKEVTKKKTASSAFIMLLMLVFTFTTGLQAINWSVLGNLFGPSLESKVLLHASQQQNASEVDEPNGMMIREETIMTEMQRLNESGRVRDYGLDGWKAPSYCPQTQDQLDSYFSRNIALIMFKNSYRGFSHSKDKLRFEFTPYAHEIQMASIRAIMDKIVLPWEQSGFKVDIFLHTYHCLSCGQEHDQAYLDDLIDAFGGRKRVMAYNFTRAYLGKDPPGFYRYGQHQAAINVFEMLRRHMDKTGKQYRTVLLKRWDIVPMYNLSSPDLHLHDVLERSLSLDYIKSHYDPENYLVWSTTFGGKCVNDLTFTIPGWRLPCYFKIVLESDVNFWGNNGFNLPGWNATARNIPYKPIMPNPPLGASYIYRGPYGVGHHDAGKVVCRMLRTQYGGPSCGPAEFFQEFCKNQAVLNRSETCEQLVNQVIKEDNERSNGDCSLGRLCIPNGLPPNDDELYTSKGELTERCLSLCTDQKYS